MLVGWNAKPAAFIIHKTIKGYPALWAKIKQQIRLFRQRADRFGTFHIVDILRHAVNRFEVDAVLSFPPVNGCTVQIRDVPERMSSKKIFLNKTDKRSTLPFVKGCRGLRNFVRKPTTFIKSK